MNGGLRVDLHAARGPFFYGYLALDAALHDGAKAEWLYGPSDDDGEYFPVSAALASSMLENGANFDHLRCRRPDADPRFLVLARLPTNASGSLGLQAFTARVRHAPPPLLRVVGHRDLHAGARDVALSVAGELPLQSLVHVVGLAVEEALRACAAKATPP